MVKHTVADLKFNVAFVGDHLPAEWQGPVAVRERNAEHLEYFLPDEAAIEHDRDLAAGLRLEHLADDGRSEDTADNPAARQPAAHTHDASSRLGFAWDMISDLTQMDRLTLDETDNDPDPHGQAFEMQGGMKRVELGVNLAVWRLAAAHGCGLSGIGLAIVQ